MRRKRTVALLALVLAFAGPVTLAAAQDPGAEPGVVRVAYPEEPVAWYPPLVDTPGSVDLAALWGLPLYRFDAHGQLRPALAAGSRIVPGDAAGPWQVEIDLRPGSWSDGEPVVAEDVVATVEVLRDTPLGPSLEPLTATEALDEDTVRFTFDGPYGRWPYLLAGGVGVLPAHVLDDQGAGAFRDGVPASGGPMRLERHEPGLVASFVPHPGSPLGAPELERLDVYFTPSYETSLGLLRDHRVDAVLGHLALNPVERARRVEDVDAAAPLGGTVAILRWSASGTVDRATREGAARAVDVSQLVEGLLGPSGTVLTSTIPGHDGPWARGHAGAASLEGVAVDLLVPRGQEVTSFTGRVLQRDLRGGGGEVTLVRVEPQEINGPEARTADGVLAIHRESPRPSLLARAHGAIRSELGEVLLAADRAASNLDEDVERAVDGLHGLAYDLPLYRVGVAHAWRQGLDGVEPSSWPGLAWWDVTAWRWSEDPPPQEPTVARSPDASG